MLGERGINLSGGQKQRAAIARALAQDPPLFVLDDALSAVDAHTEARILAALRGALAGRTSIIVSHRLAAVRDADWILVLDGGRIVEQGVHPDLLAAADATGSCCAGSRWRRSSKRRAWVGPRLELCWLALSLWGVPGVPRDTIVRLLDSSADMAELSSELPL